MRNLCNLPNAYSPGVFLDTAYGFRPEIPSPQLNETEES
jgi:hypothetical protein